MQAKALDLIEIRAMYYVCFLDLLGQRDFFGEIKKNLHTCDTFCKIAQTSYAIESLVNYVENKIRRDFCDKAGFSLFSDSLVLWLRGDEKLDEWLFLLVKLIHIALRLFIPVRGAITCGEGSVDTHGVFSGVPLLEAIEAEANRAIYPRIILSNGMRDWLNYRIEQKKVVDDDRFAVDGDGHFVLNYVGRVWLENLAFNREKKNVENITSWVRSQYCRYRHPSDSVDPYDRKKLKLAQKYVMWLDFLRRSLNLEVDDINGLPEDFDVSIRLGEQQKWTVQNYVVFYIKVESPLVEVNDSREWFSAETLDKELSWSTNVTAALGDAIRNLDQLLRDSPSYSREMHDIGIRTQYIGDYLLVYAPEERDIVRSLFVLMVLRNAEYFRKLASRGTFVRGAFTKGLGWELTSKEGAHTLYGPVMSDAYKLMMDIAWKPRVVIDERIFKIVSDRVSYGPGKDGDWISKYATRDFDGVGVVNYLVFDEEFANSQPTKAREVISGSKEGL